MTKDTFIGIIYIMRQKDRLRELLLELANAINETIAENQEVRNALMNFEREDYHVNIILATFATVIKKSEIPLQDEELRYEFTPLDKAFLNAIKIRLE